MRKNNQSDKEKLLLQRVISGDETAFWNLWEMYHQDVMSKCYQILKKDEIGAEEVYGKVLFKIKDILPKYAARITNFSSWILRITENLCIDKMRQSPRFIRFDPNREATYKTTIEVMDDYGLNATDEAQKLMEIFYIQLQRIPSKYRHVLILRSVYNKSYEEIALFFQITNETCRKRMELAKKYLKKSLAEFNDENLDTLLNNNKLLRDSRVWKNIQREIDTLILNRKSEINIQSSAYKIVCRKQISGSETYTIIYFNDKVPKSRTKLTTLKRYISSHPTGWRKRLHLAKLLYIRGKWDQALLELEKILDIYPGSIETRIMLGELHLFNGMNAKAAHVFRNGLKYLLNNSSKYFFKGMINYCNHHYDNSVLNFNMASMLEPENPYYPCIEGKVHLLRNRIYAARYAFEQAYDIDHNNLQVFHLLQDIKKIFKQYEKLHPTFQKKLKFFPEDILGLKDVIMSRCRKGLVYNTKGTYTRNYIRLLNKCAPDLPMSWDVKAAYHFFRNEWDRVFIIINQIPLLASHTQVKVKWLIAIGEMEKAKLEIYNYLSKFKNPPPFIILDLCRILIDDSQYHPAIQMLDGIFLQNFSNIQLRLKALNQLSTIESANTNLGKYSMEILKRVDTIPEAYFLYAKFLLRNKQYIKAQRFLLKGWQIQSKMEFSFSSFEGAKLLTICNKALNQNNLAKHWYLTTNHIANRIIKTNPSLGWFLKGKFEYMMDNKKEAFFSLSQSLNNTLPFPLRKIALILYDEKNT